MMPGALGDASQEPLSTSLLPNYLSQMGIVVKYYVLIDDIQLPICPSAIVTSITDRGRRQVAETYSSKFYIDRNAGEETLSFQIRLPRISLEYMHKLSSSNLAIGPDTVTFAKRTYDNALKTVGVFRDAVSTTASVGSGSGKGRTTSKSASTGGGAGKGRTFTERASTVGSQLGEIVGNPFSRWDGWSGPGIHGAVALFEKLRRNLNDRIPVTITIRRDQQQQAVDGSPLIPAVRTDTDGKYLVTSLDVSEDSTSNFFITIDATFSEYKTLKLRTGILVGADDINRPVQGMGLGIQYDSEFDGSRIATTTCVVCGLSPLNLLNIRNIATTRNAIGLVGSLASMAYKHFFSRSDPHTADPDPNDSDQPLRYMGIGFNADIHVSSFTTVPTLEQRIPDGSDVPNLGG